MKKRESGECQSDSKDCFRSQKSIEFNNEQLHLENLKLYKKDYAKKNNWCII